MGMSKDPRTYDGKYVKLALTFKEAPNTFHFTTRFPTLAAAQNFRLRFYGFRAACQHTGNEMGAWLAPITVTLNSTTNELTFAHADSSSLGDQLEKDMQAAWEKLQPNEIQNPEPLPTPKPTVDYNDVFKRMGLDFGEKEE